MFKVKQNEVKDLESTLANIASGGITIVNDLTTGGATSALSAEQGKVLGERKATTQANSIATDITTLVTDFNALLDKLKAAGLMS